MGVGDGLRTLPDVRWVLSTGGRGGRSGSEWWLSTCPSPSRSRRQTHTRRGGRTVSMREQSISEWKYACIYVCVTESSRAEMRIGKLCTMTAVAIKQGKLSMYSYSLRTSIPLHSPPPPHNFILISLSVQCQLLIKRGGARVCLQWAEKVFPLQLPDLISRISP